ncbi:MAG: acyl-CoA dehydrogenase family protein [Deltaproteobacteria bacterium]|nr:acyl-CoA dehydrogenase family protein [Deltaproteobacteria bacterium]
MDFEPTETQQLIMRTARDFAQRELMPVAAELDRESRFPSEQVKALAELGLMGVNIPAELGGAEAGVVAYSLAMMEVARGCASTSVTMAVTNMVGEVISYFGSEDQRQKYVPKLTSGEYAAGAFSLSEPGAGSDAAGMTTQATRTDGGWVLDGQKMWITSGGKCGVMVVWARTDTPSNRVGHKGISCFLVEQGTPGLKVEKKEDKMGLRGSETVPLTFDECHLPADALLGEEGQGFRIAMMALDGGRIGIASQAVGVATAALEEGLEYAKDRKQFRKPIADFQAIQWMIADSKTELEAARLLALRAAKLKEQGAKSFSREAATAKVFASEAAWRICDRMLQVHGGYGYVRDFAIERHLRDIRVARIYEGTSEVQRTVIARSLLRG